MILSGIQVEALRRSKGFPFFAYFMEQGTGKTLTSLADILECFAEGLVDQAFVCCPNSFKGGWAAEVDKHGMSDKFDVHIYESGSSSSEWWMNRRSNSKIPMLVINYEAMRSGTGFELCQRYMSRARTMAIWDESVQLKGHNTDQTKSAISLGKISTMGRLLSGRPVVQGPDDLWGQLRTIQLLSGTNYFAFRGAFCRMGGFKGRKVMGAQNEDILAERIDKYIFRAHKKDWLDLPPKMYTERDYKLSSAPALAEAYLSMESDFVVWLNENENVSIDVAISKYQKLAQIQCGFILDDDRNVRWLVPPAKNPRLKALLDVIENEVEGKFAIAYENRAVFDLLYEALAEYKPAFIKGGMSSEETEEQKRRFNTDSNCRAILLQMKAAKYGHTLLGEGSGADNCHTMLMFQNTYSMDDRSQIEDRIHRQGQMAESTLYVDFIGTDLDRDAVRALIRKDNVFRVIFEKLRKTGRSL